VAKTVDNALAVLFAVADETEEEVTLTGIARKLGMPKANVLRFLAGLEEYGLIVREKDRSIQLGFGVLALADAFHARVPLARRSLPHLRWLRDATGETAALQIVLGTERSCIQQIESPADIRWAVPVGRRYPIASGAAGKVLMAFMGEAERDALLKQERYRPLTAKSLPDLASFKRALAEVRRSGYALSDNETRMGASAAAAPVRDHFGTVVAAMTVAGPSERVFAGRLQELAGLVVQAANALSADLGWRPQRTDAA
jgi:DNA-binding IclR family transcriptional regulator